MESKQLPNEQTLEELLKTLEQTKEESIVGVSDDVFSFISTFNILPGNYHVLKSAMYDLYRKWSKDPVTRTKFGLKMNKHFKTYAKGPYIYYGLNVDSLLVEKETLKIIESKKRDKTKNPNWQKHFNDFLNYYKLSKGTNWVQSFVISYFYDQWCYKNRRKKLLSDINIFNFCKLYFKHKRNTESRMMWFAVNEEFVKQFLSPQKLYHLQQAREKKYGKKQKIKSKIPGFKTRAKFKNKVRTN